MTILDDDQQNEDEQLDLSAPETRPTGRWNSMGVPGERSKDFRNALRRLAGMLGPMWVVLAIVVVIAVTSATLNVFGPRVLGHGTDIIISGVESGQGINFGELHHTLYVALVLYEFPEHSSEIAEYVVTPALVRHRLFARGKKVLRKDDSRRETA